MFLHILFIYSTPTLIKDIRTWEKEFFKKSSISNDQRNIEFRDFAVAFGEICGGQLKAADQLDRIAQAQAKQKDKDSEPSKILLRYICFFSSLQNSSITNPGSNNVKM